MFKTRVTELLGIEHPILAGPMLNISTPEFVAAVSEAGALGIIAGVSYQTPEMLGEAIRKTRTLTRKPFAVNITLLPTARPIKYEDYFHVLVQEGVRIVETSGRSPEPYLKALKDGGVVCMHRATRIRDIQNAERSGADIVTILGMEAGGHPGQEEVTSLVRIPIAVQSVKAPVVAAGGIADARGFVAALALGAEGVLMGTRFMVSRECPIHDRIKQWLCGLRETDTLLIQKTIKNAVRVARTPNTEKVLELESRGASLEELMPYITGARGRNAMATGEYEGASISVGQCIGLLQEVPTIKQIIDGIISESKTVMQRLQSLGVGN